MSTIEKTANLTISGNGILKFSISKKSANVSVFYNGIKQSASSNNYEIILLSDEVNVIE